METTIASQSNSTLQSLLDKLHLRPLNTCVLVVEDEGFVREVTAEILEAAGYQVLKARSAAEALTVFRQCRERLDLLVADVVLPGRNGRDLAREMSAACPTMKTIFISGYPENSVVGKAACGPATFYLPKPFSVEALMEKVHEALGR
jgi:CheY-like chemotaxis protein